MYALWGSCPWYFYILVISPEWTIYKPGPTHANQYLDPFKLSKNALHTARLHGGNSTWLTIQEL